MKFWIIALMAMMVAPVAFAHPNGTYEIDDQEDVTVTFAVVGRCPDVRGALSGSLRQLSFSDAAQEAPYHFSTSHYVEIHTADGGERYVPTDDECVPLGIDATRNTFAGFSLVRID